MDALTSGWRLIEGEALRLVDEPDVVRWTQGKRIGRHPFVMVIRSSGQPGLIGRLADVLGSVDELAWKAPGGLYFCGCEDDDPSTAVLEDFAEYDGIEHLRAATG